MLKRHFFKALATIFLFQTLSPAMAMPGTPEPFRSCAVNQTMPEPQCHNPSGLIRIFDARASMNGGDGKGGGRANSCWSACFNDYNQCLDGGQARAGEAPKKACVTRMKSCLAVCDHISQR